MRDVQGLDSADGSGQPASGQEPTVLQRPCHGRYQSLCSTRLGVQEGEGGMEGSSGSKGEEGRGGEGREGEFGKKGGGGGGGGGVVNYYHHES